jgi:hypothetical protein
MKNTSKTKLKKRTCHMEFPLHYYGFRMVCSACGSVHVARQMKRCTCGRKVIWGEVIVNEKKTDPLKVFRTFVREMHKGYMLMMRNTNGAETMRGGSGRRERRTINADRR